MSWKDYNDFLEGAKENFGLTHAEAQELYRDLREERGTGLSAADLEDPRAQELAESIRDFEGAEEGAPAAPGEIADLDAFNELTEYYEEFEDFDYYDVEGNADGDTGGTET